jgi:phosphohistidine phosphatase SixA
MFVVLIRHADPAPGDDNPGLSAAGTRKAATLARMLAGTGVTAIFTSSLRRTKDTAAPLAAQLTITPSVIDDDFATAAAQVKAAGSAAATAGACVLVVGHSNTVPEIIKALGGPANVTIGATEFDRMFVLHGPASGAGSLLSMRYGV